MQPLYTEAEFKEAKSRQLLPLQCLYCNKTFYRSKNKVCSYKSTKGYQTGDFCSIECSNLYHNSPTIIPCEQCGTLSKKRSGKNKNQKHHFCSLSCAAKYRNSHKIKGTRVSKLEVWISQQLPIIYPNLEFHFNRKDAINGELDIYLPSLKLAFELNGIFHYEPIYGPEKLSSIQNNDHRKMQACIEQCIELCLIDVSTFKHFKEQRAIKFLQIIQNIIDSKLQQSNS